MHTYLVRVLNNQPSPRTARKKMESWGGKRGRRPGGMRPASIVMKEEDFAPNKERCGCCGGCGHSSNILLRCSLCNVAVHKYCYGVGAVNEHSWKCSPCSEGINADEIACILCKKEGGSFRRVVRGGKGWIHVLCAMWTPDIYFLDPMGVDGICLDAVDPDRYKLRCCLCGKRGMCMQCNGARCLVAYHPWCMFSAGHNRYPRVVTVGDAVTPETLCFSSYCPKHVSMCPVPYDPPPQPESDRETMEWMDRKSKSSVCGFSSTWEGLHHDSSHNCEGSELIEGFNSIATDDELVEESLKDSTNDGNGYFFESKLSGRASPPMLRNVYTFQQWPGQHLGHDMDLEHFWSVVGSYFPEFHPETWLKVTLNVIDKAIAKVDDIPEFGVIPTVCRPQRPIPEERKEQQLENGVEDRKGELEISAQNNESSDDVRNVHVSSSNEAELLRVCIENNGYRSSCLFELSKGEEQLKPESELVLGLNSSSSDLYHHYMKQERANVPPVGDLRDLHITLREFNCTNTPVGPPPPPLGDRSTDDEMEICQELYLARKQLKGVLQSVMKVLEPAKEGVRCHASKSHTIQKHWNSVLHQYHEMKTWKSVVGMLLSGNRDRMSGFNKPMQEDIPASWRMIVKGRPAPPSPSKVVVNPADEVDSLCSVCFDGSAPADNHIVFCDGCNIGVHQHCYGLKGIPEFEFYCDRCMFLQSKARRMNSSLQVDLTIPGIVQPAGAPQLPVPQCALCPVLHGGLKQTDDGRWVHLCCALWVPGVHIGEIANMAPISLSSVKLQSNESCVFCKHMVGALLACRGDEGNGQPCGQKFHYLCAWFAGCVMEARLPPGSDLSSGYKNGYPCAVELHCLCADHSTRQRSLEEQKSLRSNYCMKTEPPAATARFKKLRKQQSGVGHGGKRDSKPVAELYPDSYAPYPCSACIFQAGTVIGLLGDDSAQSQGSDGDDPVVCCQVCGITVHRRCYGAEKASENVEPESSWTCAACSKGIHYPQCGLCPRRGGAFFSTSRGSRSLAPMVHCYCADHTPGAAVITSHERTPCVDLMGVPSELCGARTCALCNHRKGVCVKCSHHGCSLYFHPLCARHYGLYSNPFTPSELGRRWPFKHAHYCQKHTPDSVFRLSNGYFIDAWAVYKLRQDLDRVRLIVDLVHKREKVKRAMWRTACTHFEACMDQVREEARKQIEKKVPRRLRSQKLEDETLDGGELTTVGKMNGGKGSTEEEDDNSSSNNNSEKEEEDNEFPSEAVFDLFRPYGHRLDGSPWDEGQQILEEQQSKEAAALEAAKRDLESRKEETNRAREFRRQFRGDEDQILLRRKRTTTVARVDGDTARFPGWWNGVLIRAEQPKQDFSVILERLVGYSALNHAREMLSSETVPPPISDDPKRVRLDRQLKAVVDAIVESRVPVISKKLKPYGGNGSITDEGDEPQWQTVDDSDQRLLSEMFMHVPTVDEYPKYWELIRDPIDTDSMFRKVQEFRYNSLDGLLQDVKQLVQNARTLGRKVLLNDAIRLQGVAKKAYKEATEDGKKRMPAPNVVVGDHDGTRTRNRRSMQDGGSDTREPLIKKRKLRGGGEMNSSAAEQQPICNTCGGWHILRGGDGNQLEHRGPRFLYMVGGKHCELCLNQHATSFINRRVWILYRQDEQWYKGRIQAYDPSSDMHRIVYDSDGEWEFLYLSNVYMLWLSNDPNEDPRHPPRIPDIHKPPPSKKSRKGLQQPSRCKTSLSFTTTKENQKVVVVNHRPKRNAACNTKNIGTTAVLKKRRGRNARRGFGAAAQRGKQEPLPSQVHKKQTYKKRPGVTMVRKVVLNPPKEAASHTRSSRQSKRVKSSRRRGGADKEEGEDYEDEDYKDFNYNDKKIRGVSVSKRSTRSCRTRITDTEYSSSHSESKSITTPRRVRFVHSTTHHGSRRGASS